MSLTIKGHGYNNNNYDHNVGDENRNNTSCGALLGLTKKGLEKHTEKIPGAIMISINELQKITLLGTAHKLSKGLPQILSTLLFNSTMVWIQLFRS